MSRRIGRLLDFEYLRVEPDRYEMALGVLEVNPGDRLRLRVPLEGVKTREIYAQVLLLYEETKEEHVMAVDELSQFAETELTVPPGCYTVRVVGLLRREP